MIDFFFSDPHFHHANIIAYAERPFANVIEMNSALIDRYNSVVQDTDAVLWCGDLFFCGFPSALEIVQALRGRKCAILGNHDRSTAWLAKLGFDFVFEGEIQMYIAGRDVRVSHYPYADNPREARHGEQYADKRPVRRKGEVLIHGHTHQREKRIGNMIHVGVDAWDYYPASMDEVEAEISKV